MKRLEGKVALITGGARGQAKRKRAGSSPKAHA